MRGHSGYRALEGTKLLHDACEHLAREFEMEWPRALAAGNLEARAALIGCMNRIFIENGVKPVTLEEVERAATKGERE